MFSYMHTSPLNDQLDDQTGKIEESTVENVNPF
jgi:hypothetical protein